MALKQNRILIGYYTPLIRCREKSVHVGMSEHEGTICLWAI